MKLFSNTFNVLEAGLNYSSLKQNITSQNIANIDTPNYKAKEVSFNHYFQNSLNDFEAKRTDPRHFSFTSGSNHSSVIQKKNFQYNHNGNGVDLDREMTELAKNQIYFNALSDRMSGKFNSLQSVIRGGK
ncbi:flagellar basal-body rod protein FlgB [Bacillus pakistanensis]|uniref:Flagellar basal body rod protein FlgB n=1 Tax=Rossellomorea pakistanensis TaxID=992288 RepID=A0ABS2NGX8_9BACI|nr:flagellar basal body rod protein FlgB [Bacillus pakistanensis]MBM7586826.1 flagellar basal-body rod protein FlgB [Bacillus pakistanensis]